MTVKNVKCLHPVDYFKFGDETVLLVQPVLVKNNLYFYPIKAKHEMTSNMLQKIVDIMFMMTMFTTVIIPRARLLTLYQNQNLKQIWPYESKIRILLDHILTQNVSHGGCYPCSYIKMCDYNR